MLPPAVVTELDAALLQAAITLGLAALCAAFYASYRKRYFLWWSIAWTLYVLRIGCIIGFLATSRGGWLYMHQVLTGCTALALLWAALVFSQAPPWRRWYAAFTLFPLVWSYIAIYRLQNFLLAAGPAVLFLSAATLWTGWVFLRYRRRVGSPGAGLLGGALVLWGLHHLDYPVLRARGAWSPWGYYLDIIFVLTMGVGIMMLVLEDLRRGLSTLSVLSGDLQAGAQSVDADALDTLLARPLALAGVRGSAMYVGTGQEGRFVRGIGVCSEWAGRPPDPDARAVIARAIELGRPEVSPAWPAASPQLRAHAYVAVLPIFRGRVPMGALLIAGEERDPFTALGQDFLIALGQQVGAALENADLYRHIEARSRQLEHLSSRMVQQHEEERRQIALELHDETAQVFSAVKLQLGLLREASPPAMTERFDRTLTLVDAGIRSIRSVTSGLRPPLLDDLGALPALRALVAEFAERSDLDVSFDAPAALPPLSEEAELALFRALQEALSNIARHARARTVRVRLSMDDAPAISLQVTDDGRGLPGGDAVKAAGNGHMGLAGMRERICALGGDLVVRSVEERGTELRITLPVMAAE
ncbi:MAG: GAF domain-containing sensor histidine kinase [Gemmatimonadota bacterium]|nr:GAF domain-containing sensor histidine kinase [Gemmatimonadota bacterium]